MVFRVSMGGAERLPSGDTSGRLPHKEKNLTLPIFVLIVLNSRFSDVLPLDKQCVELEHPAL